MTPEELIHLMKVARSAPSRNPCHTYLILVTTRLLAASRLQGEVTIDVWEQAKELDGRRQARWCVSMTVRPLECIELIKLCIETRSWKLICS